MVFLSKRSSQHSAVTALVVSMLLSQSLAFHTVTTRSTQRSFVLNMAKETVAVIGGGVAGLSCAKALAGSGNFLPTVFDTGRLRPGGRCASRLPDDRPKDAQDSYSILSQTVIDHAAQILTVPPGYLEFRKQVEEWEEAGIVKKFAEGTVCDIGNPFNRDTKQHDKTRIQLRPLKGDMYFGVNGMQSIPKAMMGDFPVEQDVWVSPSNGVKLMSSISSEGGASHKWQVKAKGKILGQFDKLVIAHNGKCADRLMSQTPAKDFHRLLQVNFAPYVPQAGGKRMTLNSLYSLSFAVRTGESSISKALPAAKFTSGFIKNNQNLRFISCNTRKHPVEGEDGIEVWTVLSSAKFGKAFKGPQENLPDDLIEKVTGLLYDSVEDALALPKGSLRGPEDESAGSGRVLESRLQLWGAGVPLNTWVPDNDEAEGFIYDADYGVGACGDWLLDSSLAGAWESGRRLAGFIATEDKETSGLEGRFQASTAVDKVGIGAL
jgi:predicted NAD/FAD-dependent oxidoreductase